MIISPVSYFRALQPLILLLTLVIFFFFTLLFGKGKVGFGAEEVELGEVVASSERLLEVKRADFYLMNLAALLQAYAPGIDLAVRWIVIWIFFLNVLFWDLLNVADIHENFT